MENNRNYERLTKIIDFSSKISDYCTKNRMPKTGVKNRDLALILLFNDIIELAKSIDTLYKNNKSIGLYSLLRIAFEKYLFLIHVSKKSNNADAFINSIRMKNYEYYYKIQNNDEFCSMLSKSLGCSCADLRKNAYDKWSNIYNDENVRNLIDTYRSCFDWEISSKTTELFKVDWYNFDGKTNDLWKLAKKLDKLDKYITFYKFPSSEVHSSTLGSRYVIEKIEGKLIFGIINDDSISNEEILPFATTVLLDSIQIISQIYNIPKSFNGDLKDILVRTADPNNLLKLKPKT